MSAQHSVSLLIGGRKNRKLIDHIVHTVEPSVGLIHFPLRDYSIDDSMTSISATLDRSEVQLSMYNLAMIDYVSPVEDCQPGQLWAISGRRVSGQCGLDIREPKGHCRQAGNVTLRPIHQFGQSSAAV